MSAQKNKFYLTTPIYYVNARPHIGHAYTTIVADVLARRHRLLGDDTFFLTGTDEHGQKIERSAAAAGIPPKLFADQVSASFEHLWKRMGITNDRFIRTTDPHHKQGAQKLFADLYARGQIYLSSYTGQYSIGEEMFVEGPPGTLGPDGRPTETVTEENFFFRLSDYQLPLLNLIESNQLLITPDSSRNEVLSFLRGNTLPDPSERPHLGKQSPDGSAIVYDDLKVHILAAVADGKLKYTAAGNSYVPDALRDLSVSRSSFAWGIPVPEEILLKEKTTQKHVIYVWLDALANYMTAIGYGSDAPADEAEFKKYWPADLHLVGKEITRFHCVYWPAFLLALNPALLHSSSTTPLRSNNAATLSAASTTPPNSNNAATLSAASTTPPSPNNAATPSAASTAPPNPNDAVILSAAKDPRISPAPPQLSTEQHQAWATEMLPKQITAHGWLLFDNSKMSKSKGNIVRTETILDTFGTLCPPFPLSPPQHMSTATDRTETDAGETDRRGTASAVPSTTPEPAALTAEVRPPTPHERDLFASDVLRYFLLREIPFGQDGSFSFDALITRYNADLANGYGNLVSRTLNLIQQNQNGEIIAAVESWLCLHEESPVMENGREIIRMSIIGTNYIIERIKQLADGSQSIRESSVPNLTSIIASNIGLVDGYLSANTPWKLAKSGDPTDRRKMNEVLYTAAESIRMITALLYPILPYATARVWSQLGLGDIEQAAREGKLTNLQWAGLQPGTKLGPLAPIFPRADKGLAQIMIDMENDRTSAPLTTENGERTTPTSDPAAGPRTASLDEPSSKLSVGGSTALTTGPHATPSHTEVASSGIFAHQPSVHSGTTSTTSEQPSATTQITIDDFAKIELRVAQILVAERIPKADKLLRLEVDLGYEKRQILSGIAEFYAPEDLVGRRIVVITNLAPRKMRGLESHGMLLAASAEEDGKPGKPILATMAEEIALGSRLK